MTAHDRPVAHPLRVLARPYKNTAEPGQGQVYDELVRRGHVVEELSLRKLVEHRWDVVHLHYPEGVLRRPGRMVSLAGVVSFVAILALSKFRGAKVVGTGHNTQSHEQHHPLLERFVIGAFDRVVDAMTYPSAMAEQLVETRRPRLKGVSSSVVPLTNYRWERSPVERTVARQTWDLPEEATVLLFLGLIRPYKNVPALVEAARESGDDVVLVVAGSPSSPDLEAEVRKAAGSQDRVRLVLRYIEADEVSALMSAADLVVLPFSAVLNSASTLLAISHDRPVMVPEAGALGELARRAGRDWFIFFDGEISGEKLAAAIVELTSRAESLTASTPELDWCDVENVARRTEGFYAGLVA